MRYPRSPRLTVAATEDLLDGRGAPVPLRGLLAAAAAPGRAEELAGEAAARAAFVAVSVRSALPAPMWVAPGRPIAGRLLVAKVLAITALAAGATGGVALAANSSLARPLVTAHPSTGAPQSVGERRAAGSSVGTSAATSTPTLTAAPTALTGVHATGTVGRTAGPSPMATSATAHAARADASPCAPGSAWAECGARLTVSGPPPTGETTSSLAAVPPAAARPPAAAPPPAADPPAAPPAAASDGSTVDDPVAAVAGVAPTAPPTDSRSVDSSQDSPSSQPVGDKPG